MKAAIDYKQVDMSEAEFDYYKKLVEIFSNDTSNGKDYFKNLFDVDKEGLITMVKPTNTTPWAILFFMQQVQINQRLHLIDEKAKDIDNLEQRIKKLEVDFYDE